MRGGLLVYLVLVLFGRATSSHCDMATTALVDEGNIGQTGDFNWLGVLRVHLHDGDTNQVAVSGIVLVKIKYAIANADDVVRIPKYIFQTDTTAMFQAGNGDPWSVQPVSYVTHPEFEYYTFNSIAIVELNTDDTESYPLNPICFPGVSYNTSNYLYLTGFTDENKSLEKVIYKVQYLPKQSCEEFYNRAGLSDKKRVPSSYICGFSPFNKTQCVWDNGMALVSNATGWFSLIGFGVRGPGCAAPARFINMLPYFSWINSITSTEEEVYDSPDYRRDDFEYIPTHELFKMNGSRRDFESVVRPNSDILHQYESYPFDTQKPTYFNIEPADEDAILIFPFNHTQELYKNACKDYRTLMYKEYFELKATGGVTGSVTYKISLFDLTYMKCTCVVLTVDCEYREEAVLSFKEKIDFSEGTSLKDSQETPEELFRFYPITERTIPEPNARWKPGPNMRPEFIEDTMRRRRAPTYDLYIKFEFVERAIMKFELFATPTPPTTTTTTSEAPTVATRPKLRKKVVWGMTQPVLRRVKEPVVTLVAEHEVVQETVSKGCTIRSALQVLGLFALNVIKNYLK